VLAKAIVPVVVIVPPDKPVPAVILVTVPVPYGNAGISLDTKALNDGVADAPVVGPAYTVLAVCAVNNGCAPSAVKAPDAVVDDVPPLAIPNVPANVIAPVLAVEGVNPDRFVWNVVTPPGDPLLAEVT